MNKHYKSWVGSCGRRWQVLQLIMIVVLLCGSNVGVRALENPQELTYTFSPPAPAHQTQAEADAKSAGCVSCHTGTDTASMHVGGGAIIGCTDCHGGNTHVRKPAASQPADPHYREALDQAHVKPLYPQAWNYPNSASPRGSYALMNVESSEFIRFINPGDYRIARESCGACHLQEIQAAERSMMATGAMLWGGAAYNNGILPFKRYVAGEFYETKKGEAAQQAHGGMLSEPGILKNVVEPDAAMQAKGVLPSLAPLPAWETVPPADVFRVFERGGRVIGSRFPETGLPNISGQLQRLDEPGRLDTKQSNRAPGTGGRIAIPLLNIHKTRLNDPFTWFLGTNDQQGDYRSSGCSACHVVYANDQDPRHSGPYAQAGHDGSSRSRDPVVPKGETGHPLKHEFSRAIPTSQCMICHMHQPNVFVNSFLGYTMWDYESDAPRLWPESSSTSARPTSVQGKT
jgi:hypothetical protein